VNSSTSKDVREYLEALGFDSNPWGLSTEVIPLSSPAPGESSARRRLLFVGEALGEERSEAGDLLGKMIAAMGLSQEDVLVSASLETETLSALAAKHQVEVVVALGQNATQKILSLTQSLPEVRGTFQESPLFKDKGLSLKVMPTFHPAYLLREASMKKAAWEDLKLVMKVLSESLSERGS
jgi:uracil-DNA glycosylase